MLVNVTYSKMKHRGLQVIERSGDFAVKLYQHKHGQQTAELKNK